MPTPSHNQGKHKLRSERRAIVYIRVGGGQQDSDFAMTAQRERCYQIAASHGATVVREYADLGQPARLEQQTELQRLLTELDQRRDAAYVVVWDYARLARDLVSLDDIIRRIRACGAEVATLTGVQAAERFVSSGLLDQVADWAKSTERTAPYPLDLLRAAHRGLGCDQALLVAATLPSGETIRAQVTGIGSRLGVQTGDGRLVEDIRPEWIVSAEIRRHEQR